MRLPFKGDFDPVRIELAAVALLMTLLGGALYYYGNVYGDRVQTSRVTRYVSMF